MKRTLLAVPAAVYALVSPAAAQAPGLWEHNGSLMTVQIEGHPAVGGRLVIRYYDPRQGIRNSGVLPGDTLVIGEISDYQIEGVSHSFWPGCAPFPYRVHGSLNPAAGNITLYGLAPIIDTDRCIALGYAETGNSFLRFTYVGSPPKEEHAE